MLGVRNPGGALAAEEGGAQVAGRRAPSRRASRRAGRKAPSEVSRPLVLAAAALAVTTAVGAVLVAGPWGADAGGKAGASVSAAVGGPVGAQGGSGQAPVSRSAVRGGAADNEEKDVADAFERLRKKQERQGKQAHRVQERLEQEAATKESSFRVGTFNILGSQHTRNSSRFGPGPTRAGITANLIASRGVDVVGMQEVQVDQLPPLLGGLAGYTVWPQQSLGPNNQRLQIAWRTARFEAVDERHVWYVFTSQRIALPHVLLRDRTTGAEFWVVNVHNSAGSMRAQRDEATALQIRLVNDLRAENDKPVLIVGDVNEHEEFYRRVCAATGFSGANGGGGPSCHLPPRPLRVDWIMGGGGGGVAFSGYHQDGESIARGASDHYFIHAAVTVTDAGGPTP